MPGTLKSISFTSPYDAEAAEIKRRRALATALQQQANEPLQTNRMMGRVAIPISPLEGAAQLAQSASGAYQQRQADEQMRGLGDRYRRDLADTLRRASQAQMGTPGSTEQIVDETGVEANMGGAGRATITAPGRAPDRTAMVEALMGHPATQPLALMQMQKDMENQERLRRLSQVLSMGGAAQQQPSGAGTPFEGVPPQIVALMTSGDPELVKLGTTMMEAQKGIAQRPGAPVVNPFTGRVIAQPTPAVPPGVALQVGPGGPAAYSVPGAIPAMAATTQSQAGASEAGKAPFELTTVNTEGAPTLMTRQQAIEAASGRPMPQPGQPQAAMQQIPAPQPGTTDYSAYRQVASGSVPTAYVPQGQRGLRLQDQGASSEQRKVGEQLGEYYGSAVQDAAKAGLSNRFIQNMRGAAQELRLGKLAPAQSAIIQWAQSLGIPISEADKRAAGNLQALNSMAIKLAGVATRESDSQPAAFQYAQILKAMPDIGRTEQGFVAITNYLQDLNEYKIAKLENLEAWRREHGGSSGGFEAAWRTKQNELPLFGNKGSNLVKDIVGSGSSSDPLGIRRK